MCTNGISGPTLFINYCPSSRQKQPYVNGDRTFRSENKNQKKEN